MTLTSASTTTSGVHSNAEPPAADGSADTPDALTPDALTLDARTRRRHRAPSPDPSARRWPSPWAPPSGPAAAHDRAIRRDAPRASRRRYLVAAAWIIGVAATVFVGRTALPELGDTLRAIGAAHRGWLVGALVLEIAALAVLPMPFRGALRALGGHARYRALLDATLGAFALSRVVPAGGLAGGAYAVRRITTAGNATAVAVAAVTAASVMTMASLGLVVVGGATLDAITGRGSIGVAWITFTGLVAAVTVGVTTAWLLHHPERLHRTSDRVARWIRRPAFAEVARRQIALVAPLFGQPAPLAGVAGWAAVNWVLQLAALWTVFLAFGLTMPVGVLIMGFGAANLATALPHTPGGLGVVEAGMTATYVALGVPTGTALVGVVCYRLIGHWLPVLLALPVVVPRGRRAALEVGA